MRLSRKDYEVEENISIHGLEPNIEEEELEGLRTIAMDWVEGRLVFDTDLPLSAVSMCFMAVLFMEKDSIPYDSHLYEYLSAPQGAPINGYPTFFSFRVLRRKRFLEVVRIAKEYSHLKKGFIGGSHE
jgi:hypothetical protein